MANGSTEFENDNFALDLENNEIIVTPGELFGGGIGSGWAPIFEERLFGYLFETYYLNSTQKKGSKQLPIQSFYKIFQADFYWDYLQPFPAYIYSEFLQNKNKLLQIWNNIPKTEEWKRPDYIFHSSKHFYELKPLNGNGKRDGIEKITWLKKFYTENKFPYKSPPNPINFPLFILIDTEILKVNIKYSQFYKKNIIDNSLIFYCLSIKLGSKPLLTFAFEIATAIQALDEKVLRDIISKMKNFQTELENKINHIIDNITELITKNKNSPEKSLGLVVLMLIILIFAFTPVDIVLLPIFFMPIIIQVTEVDYSA